MYIREYMYIHIYILIYFAANPYFPSPRRYRKCGLVDYSNQILQPNELFQITNPTHKFINLFFYSHTVANLIANRI